MAGDNNDIRGLGPDVANAIVLAEAGQPLDPQQVALLERTLSSLTPTNPSFMRVMSAYSQAAQHAAAGQPPGASVGPSDTNDPNDFWYQNGDPTGGNAQGFDKERDPNQKFFGSGDPVPNDFVFSPDRSHAGIGLPTEPVYDINNPPPNTRDFTPDSVPLIGGNPGFQPTVPDIHIGGDHRSFDPTDEDAVARQNPGALSLTGGIEQSMLDQTDPSDWFSAVPQGRFFSDVDPSMYQMIATDPEMAMALYAQKHGGGDYTQKYQMPTMKAAMGLATLGLLGGGPGGGVIGGGPSSYTDQLSRVEDFMSQFDQPGYQSIDPRQLYGEILNRSANTDFSNFATTEGGTTPAGPEEQIDITNSALLQSTPFMTPDAATALASRLNRAARQYMIGMAKGEVNMSYPAYLKSIGADRWIG